MEQEFALLYLLPGITDLGLARRSRSERVWLLKRLADQKKQEVDEMKRVSRGRIPR